MPSHIKFLLTHAAIGAFAGICFSALVIYLDVAGLWHLVTQTQDGPLAAAIMTVLFVITFGSVQMGRAVMALGEPRDDDAPRGPSGGELIHIRVPARAKVTEPPQT